MYEDTRDQYASKRAAIRRGNKARRDAERARTLERKGERRRKAIDTGSDGRPLFEVVGEFTVNL
jgi:hypothetical protein